MDKFTQQEDDVFANRAEPLQGEALPENSDMEMKAKIDSLESEKFLIDKVAKKDVGDDGTDQTVFNVYRDKRKVQVQTVREKLMDEMLRKKITRAQVLIDDLDKKRKENIKKIDEATQKVAEYVKAVNSAQANLERQVRSAEEYFKRLKNSRASKKRGRRGGKIN